MVSPPTKGKGETNGIRDEIREKVGGDERPIVEREKQME